MKIAVATSDGVHINEAFGRTSMFLVFDRAGSTIWSVEKRLAKDQESGDNRHGFNAIRFESVYEEIKDCDIFMVSRIGKISRLKLLSRGIQCKMTSGKIADVIG